MAEPFDSFQKQKSFLICVDSDGCAMDTMDIKHHRCFGPCMVQEWELQEWQTPILVRWNDINLYTMTRGINRFKGLAMALGEINQKYTRIEDIDELVRWADSAKELSNRSVEAEYKRTGSKIFGKALAWSEAVNTAITALPQSVKLPFSGVKQGLAAAHSFADVAVVSSANRDAVEAEWNHYGLMESVDLLCCQDAGSKAHCIEELLKKGYAPEHVLMVGDAPGDQAAAVRNGVFFYPILVRHEAENWTELRQCGLSRLRDNDYRTYGESKAKAFFENLKGE